MGISLKTKMIFVELLVSLSNQVKVSQEDNSLLHFYAVALIRMWFHDKNFNLVCERYLRFLSYVINGRWTVKC